MPLRTYGDIVTSKGGSVMVLKMFDGMTMCFHMANCPIHLAGRAYKNRARFKNWPSSPVFSARPSSVVLQTEGNENPSESRNSDLGSTLMGSGSSNLVLSQANTVGIVGGVSALSTLGYLEKLVKWSLRDGEESPPFIVCSDPVLKKEISSRNRNLAPYTRLRKTPNQFDDTLVVENLRRKRVFLEQSGACCIAMPCHISHAWHNEISQGCSVPFLHIGECVARELKEANLKPVETGSSLRIGLLAPDPTLTAGFYQEKLQDQGFEVVVPDEATMEHTVIPAMEALNRKDIEGARNLLRIALQVLLVRAVNTIILASDDMRGLLPPNDPLLKKCTDPMDALARSALQWSKSRADLEQMIP